MGKRVAIIQGHPDTERHFGHALADAYAAAARKAGHEVRVVTVAALDFPLLRSAAEFGTRPSPEALLPAQEDLLWADHYAIFFPLWLGGMPARLAAFFEQVVRPDLVAPKGADGKPGKSRFAGKTARIVVTMGMPALFFRLAYRAHGVMNLKTGILGYIGIRPVRVSLIGSVDAPSPKGRETWLGRMATFGRDAV
jgi:putative NADPH-quinone reductase